MVQISGSQSKNLTADNIQSLGGKDIISAAHEIESVTFFCQCHFRSFVNNTCMLPHSMKICPAMHSIYCGRSCVSPVVMQASFFFAGGGGTKPAENTAYYWALSRVTNDSTNKQTSTFFFTSLKQRGRNTETERSLCLHTMVTVNHSFVSSQVAIKYVYATGDTVCVPAAASCSGQ